MRGTKNPHAWQKAAGDLGTNSALTTRQAKQTVLPPASLSLHLFSCQCGIKDNWGRRQCWPQALQGKVHKDGSEELHLLLRLHGRSSWVSEVQEAWGSCWAERWDVFPRENAVGWTKKKPNFSSEGRCSWTKLKLTTTPRTKSTPWRSSSKTPSSLATDKPRANQRKVRDTQLLSICDRALKETSASRS